MLLSDLVGAAPRLALVGLAKNTGKTVTLNAIIGELADAGTVLGVTSVGRDGEEHDVIDFRIEKPRVLLGAGSLVATTDSLLRASGTPHETLSRTGIRTPLGEVLVARLRGAGRIEIAGPSAAADVRTTSDAMLDAGAAQVLIDGAIDRRAASSPDVADGLIMATGAILSNDLEEVVARTRDAVALVRLPLVPSDTPEGLALRALAEREAGLSLLIADDMRADPLPPRFVLTAQDGHLQRLMADNGDARTLIVAGALPEAFVAGLARATRREARRLTLIVGDPTHVFLSERPVEHYSRAGIDLQTLRAIDLLALTVNPVAPQSHSFDSAHLRASLAEEIRELPIFDVMHPEYRGSQPRRA